MTVTIVDHDEQNDSTNLFQLSVDSEDPEMSLVIVQVKAIISATDSEDYTGPVHFIWKDGLVYTLQ